MADEKPKFIKIFDDEDEKKKQPKEQKLDFEDPTQDDKLMKIQEDARKRFMPSSDPIRQLALAQMAKARLADNDTPQLDPSRLALLQDIYKTSVPPTNAQPVGLGYNPQDSVAMLSPGLRAIAQNESSGGKNIAHPQVNYGLNKGTTAAGSTGMMPLTAQDVVSNNKDLMDKYGNVLEMSPNKITQYLNNNPDALADISNAHWQHIQGVFPDDQARQAYAWRWGVTGAKQASDEDIAKQPYVQNFLKQK